MVPRVERWGWASASRLALATRRRRRWERQLQFSFLRRPSPSSRALRLRPISSASVKISSASARDLLRLRRLRSRSPPPPFDQGFLRLEALLSSGGSIATGDLNFLSIPSVDLTSDIVSPTDSSTNQHGMLNPFSTTHDAGQSSNMHGQEAEPTTSASSGQKVDEPVKKKRKQSQIAQVLEDYVDFKKQQSQTFVEEMKELKQKDQFTIASCVAALETIDEEELSIAEKSKALQLFKCQLNREIFLNTKDPIIRTFWLKEEISAMEKA